MAEPYVAKATEVAAPYVTKATDIATPYVTAIKEKVMGEKTVAQLD